MTTINTKDGTQRSRKKPLQKLIICSTCFSPSVKTTPVKMFKICLQSTKFGVEIKQSKLTTLEFLNAGNYTGNMCHLIA